MSQVAVTVSSAAGGAGAAVSDTTDCLFVVLRNIDAADIEYQVGAGAWTFLGSRSSVQLDINLSNTTLKTRKVPNSSNGSCVLDIHRLSGAFSTGDDQVDANRVSINAQTGTAYTLAMADAGGQVDMSNAAANTVTVPTNATVPFPIGTVVSVCMKGAGITTIAAAGGVTLQKPSAKSLAISAQYELARLHKVATDTWRVNAT
jgi:hypothetical protein